MEQKRPVVVTSTTMVEIATHPAPVHQPYRNTPYPESATSTSLATCHFIPTAATQSSGFFSSSSLLTNNSTNNRPNEPSPLSPVCSPPISSSSPSFFSFVEIHRKESVFFYVFHNKTQTAFLLPEYLTCFSNYIIEPWSINLNLSNILDGSHARIYSRM